MATSGEQSLGTGFKTSDSSRRNDASSLRSKPSHASSLRSQRSTDSVRRNTSSIPSQKSADLFRSSSIIPVDTLVTHLLAAKRSLSTFTLLVRANELSTNAQQSHETTLVLAAQTAFLRIAIADQAGLLERMSARLSTTSNWGEDDLDKLLAEMDQADADLKKTVSMLRGTVIHGGRGGETRCLADFLDEQSATALRNAMMSSIAEFKGIQQSFDGDRYRLDTDVDNLKKLLSASTIPPPDESINERLATIIDHSSNMAQLLASLTNHFDMCVTAIRTTEGALALARRRAAETQSQGPDGISISGVISEHGSDSDLEPKTAKERAEMLKVVVQDATEVDDVVQEIHDRLLDMESHSSIFTARLSDTKKAHQATLAAYSFLLQITSRTYDYTASLSDFRHRWDLERATVLARLREMHDLRQFYERYANAYESLMFEVERRKANKERIRNIMQMAQESVDRLREEDERARETFRNDVGEFLPTDLWEAVGDGDEENGSSLKLDL